MGEEVCSPWSDLGTSLRIDVTMDEVGYDLELMEAVSAKIRVLADEMEKPIVYHVEFKNPDPKVPFSTFKQRMECDLVLKLQSLSTEEMVDFLLVSEYEELRALPRRKKEEKKEKKD